MSTRRVTGERVCKVAGAGFVGQPLWMTLLQPLDGLGCLLECGDDGCREWDGRVVNGGNLFHVSESEMKDQP